MFKQTTRHKNIKPCFFFHWWKTINDNGYTKYRECNRCGCRMVEQKGQSYQPIDFGWLTYLRDDLWI
jgi:hypothetical protein